MEVHVYLSGVLETIVLIEDVEVNDVLGKCSNCRKQEHSGQGKGLFHKSYFKNGCKDTRIIENGKSVEIAFQIGYSRRHIKALLCKC